jgi:Ni/Fe-hydrogenase 1 B-type cytochrome subunit
MAGATLTALATGALMAWGRDTAPPLWIAAREVHVPAGQVLLAALALRLVLLVAGSGSAGWRDLLPRSGQWVAAWATMRFYLSGTRSRLPPCYAHNPLWGPVYLVLFGLLAAEIGLGLWLEQPGLRGLVDLDYSGALDWHRSLAQGVLWISLAHLLAVVLHDWRAGRWEVSAMINGDKVFEIERPEQGLTFGGAGIRSVRPDVVRHWRPTDGRRD